MAEITKTKVKIKDINNQVNSLSRLDKDLAQFVDFALNYSDELMEDWWDLGYEDKLWCKQLVFPGGIMFNSSEKVSTPEISPIYSLKPIKKDLRNVRKSLLVELVGTAPTSDW